MGTRRGSLLGGAVVAVVAVLIALVAVAALTSGDTTGADGASTSSSSPTTPQSSPTTAPDRPGTTASSTEPPLDPSAGTAGQWSSNLATIRIAPETGRDGYDRDLFKHWIDADHDGCNTRCEVLERQLRYDLPGLSGGGYLSIYDGYSTDDPSEFDVDHVVALAEAWDSGASQWDPARREMFANDLDSGQLVAVTAATNRSKSDRDPADWQPPNRSAWCEWGAAWIDVKLEWGLSADRAEVDALRNIMRDCP